MKKRQATEEELNKFRDFLAENNYDLNIEVVTSYNDGKEFHRPNLVVSISEVATDEKAEEIKGEE